MLKSRSRFKLVRSHNDVVVSLRHIHHNAILALFVKNSTNDNQN